MSNISKYPIYALFIAYAIYFSSPANAQCFLGIFCGPGKPFQASKKVISSTDNLNDSSAQYRWNKDIFGVNMFAILTDSNTNREALMWGKGGKNSGGRAGFLNRISFSGSIVTNGNTCYSSADFKSTSANFATGLIENIDPGSWTYNIAPTRFVLSEKIRSDRFTRVESLGFKPQDNENYMRASIEIGAESAALFADNFTFECWTGFK